MGVGWQALRSSVAVTLNLGALAATHIPLGSGRATLRLALNHSEPELRPFKMRKPHKPPVLFLHLLTYPFL